MRPRVVLSLGILLTLSSGQALAQQFGASGDFALSVERVFAVNKSRVYEENWVDGEPDYEDSYTGISFGWRGPSGNSIPGNPQGSANPLDVPRLAFDYFVMNRLSIGGSLAYASVGDSEDGQEGFGGDTTSSFLFAPRVGYAIMFSEVVGFWPQGGLSYYSVTHDEVQSESGLALTINLPFVISPVNHFALLVGPYIDLGLLGSIDYDGGFGNNGQPPDHDRTYRSIGLQVGLMGWL